MHSNKLFSLFILAALVCTAGCHRPDKDADLQGWTLTRSQDPTKVNKMITQDYQDYIHKLPSAKNSFVSDVSFLENEKGGHAVNIEEGVNGTYWEHFLIYNQDSKRVKVIKYANGQYQD